MIVGLYPSLVYLHLLLFVLWLGGDLGIFVLGQHFRRRRYSLPERPALLKLLVAIDMGPRGLGADGPDAGEVAVCRRLVVPQRMALINEGSSDATQIPLRATMDGTRRWVVSVCALLFVTT